MTTATTEVKIEPATISADDFDKAFDEAIKAESTTATPATTEPAATTAAPATTEPAATTAAPVKTEPAATTAAPVKTEPAATTAAPATTEPATTTVAPATTEPATTTVAPDPKLLAEDAARKVAAEATAKLEAEAKVKADAEAMDIKDPVLSTEQVTALDNFKKEWPDVAAAMEIRAAHESAVLETKFARALTAIVQKVYADITPMAQSTQGIEMSQARTAVLGAHPDYDTHYPKLEEWIGKQPGYLTEAYKRVYNEGTVQEVIDLVTRYKEANGVKTQALDTTDAPGKSPETIPSQKQPSAAAKTAASELAPVASQRSIPAPTGSDPMDFDGAFAEAAAAEAAHR